MAIHEEDDQAAEEVEDSHKRYQCFGNSGDGLNAADDNEGDQNCQNNTNDDGVDGGESTGDVGHNGIGLNHAADTECADCSQKGKDDTQPFPVLAALKCVHGTADHGTVLALYTILQSDESLRIFCCDTKATGKPHPQNSTRAAHGDCGADTDDVTGTNGGRQCGGQCTELRYVTFCVRIFLEGHLDSFEDIFLNEAGTEGHKQVCTNQKDDQGPAPHKPVYFTNDFAKCHLANLL